MSIEEGNKAYLLYPNSHTKFHICPKIPVTLIKPLILPGGTSS